MAVRGQVTVILASDWSSEVIQCSPVILELKTGIDVVAVAR